MAELNIHKPHIQPHVSNEDKKTLQQNPHAYIPKKYKTFAKGMEQQFAKYMVEQMNKTVLKEKSSSPGSDYYNDLLANEYTKNLSEHNNGLGIQDIILDDIYPKKMRNKAAFNLYKDHENKRMINKNKITMVGPVLPKAPLKIKESNTISLGPSKGNGDNNE